MSETINSKIGQLSYRIVEDGYFIDLNGRPWIHQYEPYIPDPSLSYEDNAIAQIDAIIAEQEHEEEEIAQQDRIEQAVSMILANQMMEV